jgi:propanediol utilization protein
MEIPVVIQYRHAHLSSEDEASLFGSVTTAARGIEQRGQFIANEQVKLIGPSGVIDDVVVVGLAREKTQVELSAIDARALGIDAPLRASGDLNQSASLVIRGRAGEVKGLNCAIIPIRHLHLPPTTAQSLGFSQNDVVSVRVKERDIEISDVLIRVHSSFIPAFHLTVDEAARFWLQTGDIIIL